MSGYWSKSLCSNGEWVNFSANVKGKEGRPPTTVGVRKLKSLGYHAALFAWFYVQPFLYNGSL